MQQDLQDEFFEEDKITIYILLEDPEPYINNSVLIAAIQKCFGQITRSERKQLIENLLTRFTWCEYYRENDAGGQVLSQTWRIEHAHELATAVRLAQNGYNVIFAPGAMFTRDTKKFDILLIQGANIHKADLKSIISKLPDTIANRIKSGSEQASRVVVDIISDIKRKDLIDGLRSGVERNSLVEEIILLYKRKCYRLRINQILGREINEILK